MRSSFGAALGCLLASAGAVAGPVGDAGADAVAEIAADLDGDGHEEVFRVERRGASIRVSLADRPDATLEFAADELACSPVTYVRECGETPPRLAKYPLDADTVAVAHDAFDLEPGDVVPGGRAFAVSLPLGESDPLNFFWNARTGQLDHF